MSSVRLAICQPSVPHYRGPTFSLLGKQPGVELTLYADCGDVAKWKAANPEGYQQELAPIRHYPGGFMWQQSMLDVMDPDRYDLVILAWDVRFLSLWPALRKAKHKGIKTVLWGHGYSKNPKRLIEAARLKLGRKADGIMLYTKTTAKRYVEQHGFDAQRVFAAQNAIDQTPIRAARDAWVNRPEELAAFQREHQLDPTQTVVFVSRLMPDNRCDLLIEAAAKLRGDYPNLKVVIIGSGPAQEGWANLAAERGISEAVLFPGAIYDEHQLAAWMCSATLFCYPVNIGLSILHAFGYGLPVVTSDDIASHNPEIEAMIDGGNGLLYADGSLDAMANQWRKLMDDAALRAKLADEALRTVTERYTTANMVQGFLNATTLLDGQARTVTVN
jgi:glycosyltransferase involved in cell wall biosynthesis